jgi:hypothetical protein
MTGPSETESRETSPQPPEQQSVIPPVGGTPPREAGDIAGRSDAETSRAGMSSAQSSHDHAADDRTSTSGQGSTTQVFDARPASETTRTPSDLTQSARDQARDQVWKVAEKARDELAKNAEPAKRFVDDQKIAGAQKIEDIAQVIRGAADQLEPELPRVAQSVRDAAGFAEQAAAALRERSVEDIVASCTNFARTQPTAFFAAAAFTGFVAARFIKSAVDRSSVDSARGNQTS